MWLLLHSFLIHSSRAVAPKAQQKPGGARAFSVLSPKVWKHSFPNSSLLQRQIKVSWSLRKDLAADEQAEKSRRWRPCLWKRKKAVQRVVQKRIYQSRMVRDTQDRTSDQNQNQEQAAETQSQDQEESYQPEQAPGKLKPENKEPAEPKLDFLLWWKLKFEDEPESWNLPETRADIDSLPTHLRPFTSSAEYQLVKLTYLQLQQSGYYWGPMTMEEAHKTLSDAPLGTFLLRDSGQPDVFFTLSYQSDDGPTSVRVLLNNLLFSLCGSQKTFPSLFSLLAFYTSSPCKLTEPYRRQRPERLKQMCRRALVRTHGTESIRTLRGLSPDVIEYVSSYPYCT